MTKSLSEFIQERRPEITAQVQALQAELQQLDAAENALNGHAPPKHPTIKEMVLQVLGDAGRGLRANEILSAIKEKHGVEIARESLSPQLTRLSKDDGKVRLNGRKWEIL